MSVVCFQPNFQYTYQTVSSSLYLFKLYEKSTSSHKAARRFRDLQDAVRCIPRRTLGCASALAVLDILHEYLRQDAAIIVTGHDEFKKLNQNMPKYHKEKN